MKTSSEINKLSTDEAAETLGVTAATIKNWQKTGRLGSELTYEAIEAVRAAGLHSRRNKALMNNASVCARYISGHGELKALLEKGVSEKDVAFVLAEGALRQFSPGTNRLGAFFSGELSLGCGDRLIHDLVKNCAPGPDAKKIITAKWHADPASDVLGLIYASLLPLNHRRRIGAYYTTLDLARAAVSKIPLRGRILDPCCGSGSFLIAAAEQCGPKNLYALDLDPIAVTLARINLYLRYPKAGTDYLYKNIRAADFLSSDEAYDTVIGNPPWGGRPEMSSSFVLHILEILNPSGCFSLIIPQALLTTRVHTQFRRELITGAGLISADYLDNSFYGVCCPSVILAAKAGGSGVAGCSVNGSFTIGRRELDPRCINLNVTDEEYTILECIRRIGNAIYLRDNADFALGVVTGDNRRLLSKSGGEPLIRGVDISPFEIREPSVFLNCRLQSCQQAAPVELYRAKEKLVYRFVGRRPVFAVDRRGRLTLNSCNLIIPRVDQLDIDYLAAVLNSSVVGFYLEKTYAAQKWLRWQLEEVPIPLIPLDKQRAIAASPNWDRDVASLYLGDLTQYIF